MESMCRMASESDHERVGHVIGDIHIKYVYGELPKLVSLTFEHFSLGFHQYQKLFIQLFQSADNAG